MPTFRHGRGTKVLVNQFDLSSYFRDASTNQSADTAETTHFGDSVKNYVIGMTDGRLTLGGMFSGDADGVDQVFQAAFGLEAPANVTYAPEGLVVGRRVWSMEGHTVNYTVSGSVSDMVATSAEVQSTGGLKSGFSVLDLATNINATGLQAEVDLGASSTQGGYAILHVTTNTATSATIKIQHSATSGGALTDIATFTALTASQKTSQKVVIPFGTTINRYVKLNVSAITGGALNAHANIIRFFAA
jgi:hypothetical protein